MHLWLRAETKKNEQRTALTPKAVSQLQENGFKVTVERSVQSIFDDSDYEKIGALLVEAGSWKTAPADAYIVGLKELPEGDSSPLPHTHIMFAHCFKRQEGWRDVLGRFDRGNGTLLDLEFLQDEKGRRVAAFGYYAGYAGAAMGVDLWCHQQLHGDAPYPSMKPFNNEDDLKAYVSKKLSAVGEKNGRKPTVMVMGALGRCGSGAVDFARGVNIPEENIIKWDINETKAGGPFKEILRQDIFINCIYLSAKIPPFITLEMLEEPLRPLTVVVDVSCDTTNPNNPIPVYTRCTTFDDPIEKVVLNNAPTLDVISIDHLPSLLPREASEFFCRDLLPTLLALKQRKDSLTWRAAEDLFRQKLEESRTAH
ncbi:Saccharopine dehydrogenase [Phlyctochytrium planicorne]|nr:Saccharopine dehydrogenase [Phlyctochytrium planicorne]